MADVELPIFPLPLVLFPGTPEPLHVFEPRDRDLLRDCLAGDQRFGLSLMKPGSGAVPQPGDVGCTARITSHDYFPDGRANLLAVGEDRYVLKGLVEQDRAYLVARVEFYRDAANADAGVAGIANRVREQFAQVIGSLDETGGALGGSPDPPDDPEALSFAVSAALETDLATKEELLRLTSTAARLERLHSLLEPVVRAATERAALRKSAKRNGRRPTHTPSGE
jgi:Lon protease-like protein